MAMFYSSQGAQKVAGNAIEWAGGARETGIEKLWRDSMIVSHRVVQNVAESSRASTGTIYEGTSNIQLQTIAKIIHLVLSLLVSVPSSHFERSPQGLRYTEMTGFTRNVFHSSVNKVHCFLDEVVRRGRHR